MVELAELVPWPRLLGRLRFEVKAEGARGWRSEAKKLKVGG